MGRALVRRRLEGTATVDSTDILSRFERQTDGSWICREAVTIATHDGPKPVEPGMTFHFGEQVDGLDIAEMLERLGAQFGS